MRTSTTLRCFAGFALAGLFLLSSHAARAADASGPDGDDSIAKVAEKARNLARSVPAKNPVPDAAPPKRVLAVDQPAVIVTPRLNVLDEGRHLENTNLYSIQQPTITHTGKDFQGDMDFARERRIQREFAVAEGILQKLMAATAPADIHRQALMELALLAQDQTNITRAIQIFSQFTRSFPEDERIPEIHLRLGLLYREAGSLDMALNRFYLVMTSAVQLRLDEVAYYKRLVLQAQAEIADTLALRGKFSEAAEKYVNLLSQGGDQLNRPLVHAKLIRCYSQLGRNTDVVIEGERFLQKHPDSSEMPEVRFLLARIYKQTNRNAEATKHTLKLLQSQQAPGTSPDIWAYWQQRTGNDIANQLYREGDYLNALAVYSSIAQIGANPGWQLPAQYQIGLIYERLGQSDKARETYAAINARGRKDAASTADPALASVVEMAGWRGEYLKWIEKSAIDRELLRLGVPTNSVNSPATIAVQ